MDWKQALQQKGGANASTEFNNVASNISNTSKSSANSVQSDGGNNSSCSNQQSTSTNTGESKRGSSPISISQLASFVGDADASLRSNNCSSYNTSRDHSVSGRLRPASELNAHDSRLLKLARLHDAPSVHSCSLETQAFFTSNGGFNSCSNHSTGGHHCVSSFLSKANLSSSHGNPIANSAAMANTCSLFNGGSHSKMYPYAALYEESIRDYSSASILSAVPASEASILSSASRPHHAGLPSLYPEPPTSFFSAEQLLEFTQQTYIFKHLVAGVAPPPSLLLPIINSVSRMSCIGAGHLLLGGNAGLLGVGGLRGSMDPEPGRCRRTDGKKWRCAREVVADQKYCEKHIHRGRHRARANKPLNASSDILSTVTGLSAHCAANTAGPQCSNAIPVAITAPLASSAPKEPHLQFSLQPASSASIQTSRSSCGGNDSIPRPTAAGEPLTGVNRPPKSNSTGRPLSGSSAAQPERRPNLAALLKANAFDKAASLSNHHVAVRVRDNTDYPFCFAAQATDRDAGHSSLSPVVDNDPWSRSSRIADNSPSNLSWFEQLSEETKRSSFNTELSIATLRSPLANLNSEPDDDLVGGVDASHFMGLSMDISGAKVSGISKPEEDSYTGRNTWVPIAWDSPLIGGPLGEVLQSNGAANSGVTFGGSLADSGGERCLNLIEESWAHQEPAHVGSSAKGSHSPSLASPTGVLQMKGSFASYSDSSSSASSPRSALKLDSSANLGIL